MSNNTTSSGEALAKLRARAAEHERSANEEYQEYAAGIRDAITALEPFVGEAKQSMPTREEIERVVYSYAKSPMLVDELMHLLSRGKA